MFEGVELGRSIPKDVYAAEMPKLREGLLRAQRLLIQNKVPLILVIAGADGAGKSETVNRLHEWLDPRGLETHVFGPLSDEERDRPAYWRFWRTLPAKGRVGIFFGSWYTDPIVRRVYGETSRADLDRELARIAAFEQMLVQDGALLVKIWLHLSKKAQKKRLRKLEKNAATRWRVSRLDWKHFKLYDDFMRVDERSLRATDTGYAPWTIVEAVDDRYRELTVGRTLLVAVERRCALAVEPSATAVAPPAPPGEVTSILDTVDLTRKVSEGLYEKKLARLQGRLSRLARDAWEKKVSSVVVFEGWDAAGKGGSIRRLTAAMDARLYRVVPIAAPTDEERAHHYLWRFWRHIPRAGLVTIFDRSWYGRVLVERVEGFAPEPDWQRAYSEIGEFESELVEHGITLVKFWIHISQAEQLRRFEERKATAYKQHKITEEDWRNREKWNAYEAAVGDMVARTSTRRAPWTIVAGNDKRLARIQVLETFCERLEKAL
jgi:polyphosphate:AMP phosphotransferase